MEEEEWYKQAVIDKVSGEGEMSRLQGKGIFLMTLLIYNVMFKDFFFNLLIYFNFGGLSGNTGRKLSLKEKRSC